MSFFYHPTNKPTNKSIYLADSHGSIMFQIMMARHRFSTEEVRSIRRSLLAWYDANKRKLPWRDWHDTDSNIVAYRGAWSG